MPCAWASDEFPIHNAMHSRSVATLIALSTIVLVRAQGCAITDPVSQLAGAPLYSQTRVKPAAIQGQSTCGELCDRE